MIRLFDFNKYDSTIKLEQFVKVETNGCSASNFYKVTAVIGTERHNCFAKLSNTSVDWFSLRSNDHGREGHLLRSSLASRIWKYFYNPYRCVIADTDDYGLLMEDMSQNLLSRKPNSITMMGYDNDANDEITDKIHVRKPSSIEEYDDLLLSNLAKLHSEFWNDSSCGIIPHIMQTDSYLSIVGPYSHYKNSSQPIAQAVMNGWKEAFQILPKDLVSWINRPVMDIVSPWMNLPKTLLHGDFRPSNIGLRDSAVVLIDWGFCGFAPATIDLYWYIATTSHERTDIHTPVNKYRGFLEGQIGFQIADHTWNDLCQCGIVTACYMQLWEKALNLSLQDESSKRDWVIWSNLILEMFEESRTPRTL